MLVEDRKRRVRIRCEEGPRVKVGMMDVSRKTEANFGRGSSTNCGRSWYQVSEKRSTGMGRGDAGDVMRLCMADNSRGIE